MGMKKYILIFILPMLLLSGCSQIQNNNVRQKLNIVATTPLIADFVRNVVKDKANVSQLVPNGADPHSYEPTFRQVRDIAYANIAFSNYLTLEEHSLIKMIDNNLSSKAKNIQLAETAIPKGIKTIKLVEDRALDTIWLGLKVQADKKEDTFSRSSQVEIRLKKAEGPGSFYGYLTETFGEPNIYFDSTNYSDRNKAILPIDAHTHMSWAFTKPGVYKATFEANYVNAKNNKTTYIDEKTFTFAVGINTRARFPKSIIVDKNHADITVDMKNKKFIFTTTGPEGDEIKNSQTQKSNQIVQENDKSYDPKQIVVDVPNKALTEIPGNRDFKFLGNPGSNIYLLPQAVLGKHVHGQIDPHMWLNVENVKYYVDVIAQQVSQLDPKNTIEYKKNADEYKNKLDKLNKKIISSIETIPEKNRYLVTTHDSFGYFSKAYGMKIAGFVTPNPSTQPSVSERKKLTETISNLKVKAVFLEPNIIVKSSVLKQIADEQKIKICPIWSDTFTGNIKDYITMMNSNINSIQKCLR